MEKAVAEGITSFKCFLVYKKEGMMVDDATLARLLLRAKELGAMINVHAENPDLIDLNTENFLKEGKISAWYHYLSRPEFVEAEADQRAVHWAKHLDAPIYIVHMADKEGLEACIRAKEEGAPVYVETCPQYLEFTCDVYKREDGRNFVCSPPMKGQESLDALWEAIKDGFIDTIATDHCPFQSYEKDWGKDDFTKIPNGCAGVETQTSRCLLCENAPCSHACTSHLPVSDIIRSFRFENHMGAAEKVGNVSCMDCSNPVCMSACRRSKLDSAVEIPKVIAQVVSIIENMPKEVAKCKVDYEVAWTRDTVYYDKTLVGYVQEAVDELGYSNQRINSGAGHDAQFASYMLPTTMVFVPSKDGHSHCEPEFTSTKQCTMGASVLLNAVLKCDKED